MIVSGRYELLEVLHEQGVRTHRARHVSLGQTVMVHLIPESLHGDASLLLERLAALPDAERRLFFDAGEHGDSAYLVSWPLEGFDSLPEWLDRAIRRNAPTHSTQPRRPETAKKPVVAAEPKPVTPAAAKPEKTRAGEFTRMFFKDVQGDSKR